MEDLIIDEIGYGLLHGNSVLSLKFVCKSKNCSKIKSLFKKLDVLK